MLSTMSLKQPIRLNLAGSCDKNRQKDTTVENSAAVRESAQEPIKIRYTQSESEQHRTNQRLRNQTSISRSRSNHGEARRGPTRESLAV
jgi:hypothetical protein